MLKDSMPHCSTHWMTVLEQFSCLNIGSIPSTCDMTWEF